MDAHALLEDLTAAPQTHAVTMGNLAKIRYTHEDMIDYLIVNPQASQNQLAARYGYSAGWVSNIMASDAWKAKFAARREEIVGADLVATVKERFEGLTHLSLVRLQAELEKPACPPGVMLKALELGAKAMGVGGNAQPVVPSTDHLAQLANRLIDLQSNIRRTISEGVTLDGQSSEVSEGT